MLAVVLSACGSSSNNSSAVNVRFVNAAKSAALTVTLNSTVAFSNVAAGTASAYASESAGNYTVSVSSASSALTSSASQTFALASGQTYTLLAYERDGVANVALLTEYQAAPPTGYATVGIQNASPDAGTLDIYVVAPGSALTNVAPTYQYVQYGASISSRTIAAGTYDIVATATGDPTDVRSRISSEALTSGQILMVAYSTTSGGALADAELLNQGGSVQMSPTTFARARVISALPNTTASSFSASVGGTSVGSTPALPLQGSYTLVNNSTSYSATISVSGTTTSLTVPAFTFAAGGDYTILAYGTSLTSPLPSVTVLTDNNQAPLASNVNLRLVNVAANTTGANPSATVTLYENNLPIIATGVAYASASPYLGLAATSSASLQAFAGSFNTGTLSATNLGTAGAVYSVFVNDTNSSGATLVLNVTRDR